VLCFVAGKGDYNFGYNAFFLDVSSSSSWWVRVADMRLPLLRGGSRALETRLGFRAGAGNLHCPLRLKEGVGGDGQTVVVSVRWRRAMWWGATKRAMGDIMLAKSAVRVRLG
jgi:hypothetical protein